MSALLLSWMGLNQLLLVLLNRTTLDAEQTHYDLGPRANWEQVFGRRVHLWPLPLYGAGPAGNGVSWPISPKIAAGLPTGARSPPARGAVRARWGSVLWAPLWVVLQWEHWFCCGGFSVGMVRQTLRLCLLARSNLGYPSVRTTRVPPGTSSSGSAARHE